MTDYEKFEALDIEATLKEFSKSYVDEDSVQDANRLKELRKNKSIIYRTEETVQMREDINDIQKRMLGY